MNRKPMKGQAFALTIPPGETETLNESGANCYIVVATGVILMRPRLSTGGVGAYTQYQQGTGFENTEFDAVDVKNPNATAVVVQIWIGDMTFTDKRLLPATQTTFLVVNPLYSDPSHSPVTSLPILDISGGSFFDINGKKWLAIIRDRILLSNVDSGQIQLLQAVTNAAYNTGAAFAIQPETEIGLAVAGDFRLVPPSGNLNCIVAEVYQAIAAP